MSLNDKLESLRVNYKLKSFDLKDCAINPIDQFQIWFKEALTAQLDEPNAFTLSTVHGEKPRSRVVLLKGIENDRFVFYTNYSSHKAEEINLNPFVAMNFLWLPLQRQVRIEGKIQRIDTRVSDDYFKKRPRESQIGAWASLQSSKLSSRDDLEKSFKNLELKFANQEVIPRPENWGGYEVEVSYIEFWQGRSSRLHDRIAYEKTDSADWSVSRLSP